MNDVDEFLRLFSDIGTMQAEIMHSLRRSDPMTGEALNYAQEIGKKLIHLAETGDLP